VNWKCNSLLQNDKPNFNVAAKMSREKKIQNTVKIKDFSKTKGFNSSKKYSIILQHELELLLFSKKQYTKFQSYSCNNSFNPTAAKMAKKVWKTEKNLKFC
jgi:hypothetical protein